MANAAEIKEHVEVRSSDGQHVGTVDHMDGSDKIKLTKNDAAAHGHHHHFIPLAWVDHVDAHVHLSKTADDVKAHWEHGSN
jgi:hypothetical protein